MISTIDKLDESKDTTKRISNKMILLLHVIDEKQNINLSEGSIVFPIEKSEEAISTCEDLFNHIDLMTSDSRIVRIRDALMAEVVTDDPTRVDPTNKLRILKNGTRTWYKNDQLHRNDGPAVEKADGSKVWYKNGQCHRDEGPAIERADGSREWWKNGQCHRDDGPALEKADGSKVWYKNGQCHRDDGPAYESVDGSRWWYKNGQQDRSANR